VLDAYTELSVFYTKPAAEQFAFPPPPDCALRAYLQSVKVERLTGRQTDRQTDSVCVCALALMSVLVSVSVSVSLSVSVSVCVQ
jgi:hypothetical protein